MSYESLPLIARKSPRTPTTCRSEGNYHSHQTTALNTVSYVSGSFSSSPMARKVPGDLLVPSRTQEMPRKRDASSGCAATSRVIDAHSFRKLSKSSEILSLCSRNSTEASNTLSLSSRTQQKCYASSGYAATLL
jgi:hypothetical protein